MRSYREVLSEVGRCLLDKETLYFVGRPLAAGVLLAGLAIGAGYLLDRKSDIQVPRERETVSQVSARSEPPKPKEPSPELREKIETATQLSIPLQAAKYVVENIEYKKDSEENYPEKRSGRRYVSLGRILETGKGNCMEGFSAIAAILEDDDFEPTGFFIRPVEPKGDGHVVFLYKGKDGRYGTAGISSADYYPAIFDNLEDIAFTFCLSGGNIPSSNRAKYGIVRLGKEDLVLDTDGIESTEEEVGEINMFERLHTRIEKIGKAKIEMGTDGYKANNSGIVEDSEIRDIRGVDFEGKVESVRRVYFNDGKGRDRELWIEVGSGKGRQKSISIDIDKDNNIKSVYINVSEPSNGGKIHGSSSKGEFLDPSDSDWSETEGWAREAMEGYDKFLPPHEILIEKWKNWFEIKE